MNRIGQVQLLAEIAEQARYLRLHGDIEGGHRLIADEQFWGDGQARNAHGFGAALLG